MTAIAFALAIGALAGAFNGLLVVGLRIPAIVATLGTLGLYRGVMLLWTGGKWIEGLPNSLKALSEPALIGISPLAGWCWRCCWRAAGYCRAPLLAVILRAVGDNSPRPPARGGGEPHADAGILPLTAAGGLRRDCVRRADWLCAQSDRQRPGDEGHRRLRARRDLAAWRYRHAAGRFLGAFFLTQIDTVLALFRLPAWWNDFIAAWCCSAYWCSTGGCVRR